MTRYFSFIPLLFIFLLSLNTNSQNSTFSFANFFPTEIRTAEKRSQLIDSTEIIAHRNEESKSEIIEPKNWQILYFDSTALFQNLYFIDENTGWVVNSENILFTTNGGESWNKQYTGIINLNVYLGKPGIYFLNKDTGFVSGNGFILRTTNAGSDWYKLNLDIDSDMKEYSFTDIYLPCDSIAYVMAIKIILEGDIPVFHRYLFISTDRCNNWSITRSELDLLIFKEYLYNKKNNFPKDSTLFRVRNRILYKSMDNGENWKSLYPPALSSIYFVNSRIGYAISAKRRYILKTTTGGE